jgi:hypothetical protein
LITVRREHNNDGAGLNSSKIELVNVLV